MPDTRHVEGGSRIRVISADVPGAWGLGGTSQRFRVFCEELSEWRSEELWSALASATGKAPDAQIVIASNAGWDRDRSWQYRIRETARTKARPCEDSDERAASAGEITLRPCEQRRELLWGDPWPPWRCPLEATTFRPLGSWG